jgi:flagellar basal body rod protein FlgG
MAKAKPVIKAAALDKTINSSTEALSKASDAAGTAVISKVAEAKSIADEIQRHLKKKSTLTKRSKVVIAKYKKSPDAAGKKSVGAIEKELKLTQASLVKARASKVSVVTELTALRAVTRRLNAYTKAITAADKVLNKPVRRKKKSAIKAIKAK